MKPSKDPDPSVCEPPNRICPKVIADGKKSRGVHTFGWNPHPKFPGVFLKHLVTGPETGGRLSLHHVRVDPGCAIGDHSHAGMVEIHDVLDGTGICILENEEIPYGPGTMGIMPADQVHRVVAGDRGLLILATFAPPLV